MNLNIRRVLGYITFLSRLSFFFFGRREWSRILVVVEICRIAGPVPCAEFSKKKKKEVPCAGYIYGT